MKNKRVNRSVGRRALDVANVNVANRTVYTPYRHNPDATDPCNSAIWRKENLQFWRSCQNPPVKYEGESFVYKDGNRIVSITCYN